MKASCYIILLCATLLIPIQEANGQHASELPYRKALNAEVAFWKLIFGKYYRNQYLIHDREKLQIVYKSVTFDSSLSEKKVDKALRALKNDIEDRLKKWHAGKVDTSKLLGWEKNAYHKIAALGGDDPFLKAAKRIRAQQGIRNNFMAGVTRSYAYLPHIRRIFDKEGMPDQLIYLPHVESSFQPAVISHVGAAGMWQFMRGSAKNLMKLNKIKDERFDPLVSARAAARMLKYNYGQLGDWALTLTSYNHGLGSMRKAKRRFGKNYMKIREGYLRRSFGFASKNFYPEFLAVVEIMDSVDVYFPNIPKDPLLVFDEIKLPVATNLTKLASSQKISLDSLRWLNPGFIDDIWEGKIAVPKGYQIRLPESSDEAAVLAYLQSAPGAKPGSPDVLLAGKVAVNSLTRKPSIAALPAAGNSSAANTSGLPERKRRIENEVNSLFSSIHFSIPEDDAATWPLIAFSNDDLDVSRKPFVYDNAFGEENSIAFTENEREFLAVRMEVETEPIAETTPSESVAVAEVTRPEIKDPAITTAQIAALDVELQSRIKAFQTAVARPGVDVGSEQIISITSFSTTLPEDQIWSSEAALLSAATTEQGILVKGSPSILLGTEQTDFLAVETNNISSIVVSKEEPVVASLSTDGATVRPIASLPKADVNAPVRLPLVSSTIDIDETPPASLLLAAEARESDGFNKPLVQDEPLTRKAAFRANTFLAVVPSEIRIAELPLLAASTAGQKSLMRKPGPTPDHFGAPVAQAAFIAVNKESIPTKAASLTAVSPSSGADRSAVGYSPVVDTQLNQTVDINTILAFVAKRLLPRENAILVHPDETLWNYADWLNVSTTRLRALNQLRGSRNMQLGQLIKLDFSNQTVEAFHRKRADFHNERIRRMLGDVAQVQIIDHTVRSGENIWTIARKRNKFPVNLLLYFNDLNKLAKLFPGDIVKLPVSYN
ncbi:MAG: transglycosylase SLT domain-containing protein [Calditrichia bacterium]